MKIACIGAGASGLCFAYKLQRSFEDFTLTIFERNDSVGGVWVTNRYPGFVVLFFFLSFLCCVFDFTLCHVSMLLILYAIIPTDKPSTLQMCMRLRRS